ncbi:3-methyl-2-oxobutanoate hydroxymethyltransferase [bacterium]|nr:3-methyl-2-oxobutanoate hydroxymethyltransferase [bacterium]
MTTAKPVTVNDFKRLKNEGVPISVLTAYDAVMASLIDQAGVDLILVGDSLANVFQGRETTIPVTIEEMIYHTEIVVRSVKRAFVAADMPFMSFQVSPEEALRNAGTVMKKTGCKAVKLEGGVPAKETIRRIVQAGIPVIGHIGLTPQSVHALGGYGLRGKDNGQALIEAALAVQEAGAFAIVIEKIPRGLAAEITRALAIPTIGIGAGPDCDGQVLVTNDILGLNPQFKPKFVRRYDELAERILSSLKAYKDDVRSRRFPGIDESYE